MKFGSIPLCCQYEFLSHKLIGCPMSAEQKSVATGKIFNLFLRDEHAETACLHIPLWNNSGAQAVH